MNENRARGLQHAAAVAAAARDVGRSSKQTYIVR